MTEPVSELERNCAVLPARPRQAQPGTLRPDTPKLCTLVTPDSLRPLVCQCPLTPHCVPSMSPSSACCHVLCLPSLVTELCPQASCRPPLLMATSSLSEFPAATELGSPCWPPLSPERRGNTSNSHWCPAWARPGQHPLLPTWREETGVRAVRAVHYNESVTTDI